MQVEHNVAEAAAELFALNKQMKMLDERATALKELLKAAGSWEDDMYSVTVRTTERKTVDSKMLQAKYASIAAECSKVTSVTSVKVEKV